MVLSAGYVKSSADSKLTPRMHRVPISGSVLPPRSYLSSSVARTHWHSARTRGLGAALGRSPHDRARWLLKGRPESVYDCESGEDAITVAMMGSNTSVMTESQGCGEPSTGTPAAEFCWRGKYSGRKPTSSAGGVLEMRAVVERV